MNLIFHGTHSPYVFRSTKVRVGAVALCKYKHLSQVVSGARHVGQTKTFGYDLEKPAESVDSCTKRRAPCAPDSGKQTVSATESPFSGMKHHKNHPIVRLTDLKKVDILKSFPSTPAYNVGNFTNVNCSQAQSWPMDNCIS